MLLYHDPCRDMRVNANSPRLTAKPRGKAIRMIIFNRIIPAKKAIKRNYNNRYGRIEQASINQSIFYIASRFLPEPIS